MTYDLLDDIEIAAPVASNGHAKAFKLVCSNCGDEFDSNRRQLPGKHVWCQRPDCRKAANAQRQKDWRARRRT